MLFCNRLQPFFRQFSWYFVHFHVFSSTFSPFTSFHFCGQAVYRPQNVPNLTLGGRGQGLGPALYNRGTGEKEPRKRREKRENRNRQNRENRIEKRRENKGEVMRGDDRCFSRCNVRHHSSLQSGWMPWEKSGVPRPCQKSTVHQISWCLLEGAEDRGGSPCVALPIRGRTGRTSQWDALSRFKKWNELSPIIQLAQVFNGRSENWSFFFFKSSSTTYSELLLLFF